MKNNTELTAFATQVRRDILRMVHQNASGHPGGALGATDFLSILYNNFMTFDAKNFSMDGKNEDLFFLSNGHLSALFYSVLARVGYFDIHEMATFRSLNSRLQGHPTTAEGLPGIRIASGSLGQGLSVAIGAAVTKKLNGDAKKVYVLMGDGEIQEGNIWEAALFAPHHKIDNLIAVLDYNGKQIDGNVNDVLSLGNIKAKWDAFGWEVLECDGHDFDALNEGLKKANNLTGNGKPIIIILKTIMGKGVDFMENNHKWHGSAPNDEQLEKALSQLSETLGDY